MANVEAELQAYLQLHKVESLMKELIVKICVAKPADVLEFIKEYVSSKQQKESPDKERDAPTE
jgi:cAMP-dependent protein kinase regulator